MHNKMLITAIIILLISASSVVVAIDTPFGEYTPPPQPPKPAPGDPFAQINVDEPPTETVSTININEVRMEWNENKGDYVYYYRGNELTPEQANALQTVYPETIAKMNEYSPKPAPGDPFAQINVDEPAPVAGAAGPSGPATAAAPPAAPAPAPAVGVTTSTQISWGSAATQPSAQAPNQIAGTQPAPAPTAPPNTWHVYKGPGTQQIVSKTPLTQIPQGYAAVGQYQLSQDNIDFLSNAVKANPNAAVTFSNNKVTVTNADGTKDISAGAYAPITGWAGPDKFSYDDKTGIMYDGKKVVYDSGAYQFVDESGAATESYVKSIPGGAIKSDAKAGVTIMDSQGRTVNTFTQKEWEAWSPTFNTIDNNNKMAAAFAIKDLGLSPADVTTAGNTLTAGGRTITLANGAITVKDGNEQVTYSVVNGQKSVSHYETTSDGKTTKYDYDKDANGKAIVRIDGTQYNTVTLGRTDYLKINDIAGVQVVRDARGNLKYFDYSGKELSSEAAGKFEEANKEQLESAKGTNDKVTEAKRAQWILERPEAEKAINLGNFIKFYRNFQGLSGWSSLIFDKEFLEKWRTSVNEFFCKTVVLGGLDCWTSKICGTYTDMTPPREGVLYNAPVGGAIRAVAHIEAQRSMPIITPTEVYWGYTITFSLTNPNQDKSMSYNVWFEGEKKSSWWGTDQTLSAGATTSAVGASALYKISMADYYGVCIVFNPSITSLDGKSTSKVCNKIVPYTKGATAPYTVTTATETTTGAPTTPGAPAQATTAPGASI